MLFRDCLENFISTLFNDIEIQVYTNPPNIKGTIDSHFIRFECYFASNPKHASLCFKIKWMKLSANFHWLKLAIMETLNLFKMQNFWKFLFENFLVVLFLCSMFSYFPVKYLLYYRNPLEAIQTQIATIYKFSLCQNINFGNLNGSKVWEPCSIAFYSFSNFFPLMLGHLKMNFQQLSQVL